MSVLHTESFIGFEAVNSTDDTYTTANSAARKAVRDNLISAGYNAVIDTSLAGDNYRAGWAIRPDPLNPDRNALFFSSGNTGGQSAGYVLQAAIQKPLTQISEALVGGFSLFIPPEFVKAAAASNVTILRVTCGMKTDTQYSNSATSAAYEVFRVCFDLCARWSGDAPQSSKALNIGKQNYIEYKVEDGLVSVWFDDVLVMQKVTNIPVEYVAIQFFVYSAPSGATLMGGAPARWAIGNWYNLSADAKAPNQRLGPTTRVIGVRPSADVSAQFVRPAGYASNAAVVGQNIVSNPPATLQSTNIGDQDVYSSGTDAATSSGSIVHAVVTKTIAANLESAAHALRPLIRASDGTEVTNVQRAREFRSLAPISQYALKGVACRPTDGKLFAVGYSACVLTNSANGADGTTWTTIVDEANTVTNGGIAFRSDGVGVIARSDGKVGVILAGQNTPTLVVPASNATLLTAVMVLPDGTFVVIGNAGVLLRSKTPDVAASWTKTTFGSTGNAKCMAYSSALNRIVVVSSVAAITTSDDGGATWTSRTVNGTMVYSNVGFDGTYFSLCNQTVTTAGYWYRSSDAITWTAISSLGAASSQKTPYACGNDTGSGLSVMVCDGGYIYTSHNSSDWRTTTPLSYGGTAGVLRALCQAQNGDWIIVGDAGFYAVYSPSLIDTALPSLGGYAPQFNASNTNPVTGLAWTPSEASQVQFGMRLTS